MTSETDTLKTNEFLRRRKLRLQQVREQSKDIAKKIRQRAKAESLRQVVDLDSKKQKEYFDRQDKLVRRLEVLYARGLNNVGASHQSAGEETRQEGVNKTDLSKVRGKEAAAELRKKRQEKLDEQKKLLDRKLQARESANEISRDKSSLVANKLSQKTTVSAAALDVTNEQAGNNQGGSAANVLTDDNKGADSKNEEPLTKNDMATQWDLESMPNEWEPTIPTLTLPRDDQGSLKENDNVLNKSDRSKRLDLFALSNEMPSDLRGSQVEPSVSRDRTMPSLTLVSEYLQSRKLRLRETEVAKTKRPSEDMQSLKQTIQKTRTTKAEGKHTTCSAKTKTENVLNRKSSVQIYNHVTRDTRDMPCSDEQLVVRDLHMEEDAYSQALKESSVVTSLNVEHKKKVQDMRNKVAVTKQTVEKEYKDTINFLNSLPKDKGNKLTKTAYMDDRRQQIQQNNRQRKMQQEFRKIEKECNRHQSCMDESRSKSKSPSKRSADDFTTQDFEYSWMPVPESDENLAIHTIPNSVKSGKSNNNVKFSKVDSYHEYRSRHKHTPPTKEIAGHGNHSNKKRIVIENSSSNSTDDSSTSSDTSSVENLNLAKKPEKDQNLSDAERIIIYKILDSKSSKNAKKKNKYLSDIAKSLTSIKKVQKSAVDDNQSELVGMKQSKGNAKTVNKTTHNTVSFEQINEGVYRVAEQKGRDNIASMNFSSDPSASEPNETKHYAHQKQRVEQDIVTGNTSLQWDVGDDHSSTRNLTCHCPPSCKHMNTAAATTSQPTAATTTHQPATATTTHQPAAATTTHQPVAATTLQPAAASTSYQPTAATSTSSFKTAPTETPTNAQDGCVKFVDEDGQETGKFFLGAAGLLKDNAYEVVIQLRKKDDTKHKSFSATELPKHSNQFSKNHDKVQSESFENSNLNPSVPEKRVLTQANSENELHESKRSMEDIKQATPLITADNRTIQQSTEAISDPSSELLTKNSKEKNNVPDKAEFCQVAYQIPVSNFYQPSRPPTTTYSAYTQTTNSPDSRPLYLHMSSSTSTAYMSPPELILPKYMRGTSTMTENETCAQSINVDDNKNNKKCKHARKTTNKRPTSCKRNEPNIPIAPPNSTARIRQTTSDDFEEQDLMPACKINRIDKTKCKCRNCGTRVPSKHCVKQQSHKNKHPFVEIYKGPHSKVPGRTRVSYKKNNAGANLNPIVKEYVNKLLALNREGLKAMEVADQECSSVGTPGSSIINVPYNIDERKSSLGNKISIEHIKQTLIQQIIDEHIKQRLNNTNNSKMCSNQTLRNTRKKPVHKVKSLNISKNLLNNPMNMKPKLTSKTKKMNTLSSLTTDDSHKTSSSIVCNSRSHSSPSPRSSRSPILYNVEKSTPIPTQIINKDKTSKKVLSSPRKKSPKINQSTHHRMPPSRATNTDTSQESASTHDSHAYYKHKPQIPISMSTQTSQNIDSEFMKLAEDKLNNMEKIADLTEKCTKRLSNLAKVLEEVRKNKSSAYSQISTDSTDNSDHRSDKIVKSPVPTDEPNGKETTETITSTESKRAETEYKLVGVKEKLHPDYMPFLTNISKPAAVFQLSEPMESSRPKQISLDDTDTNTSVNTKFRAKPPPALSRVHLKHCSEHIMPHELSTVIEVDSPMSVKNKNLSSRNDAPNSSNRSSNEDKEQLKDVDKHDTAKEKDLMMNPDLLQSNLKVSKPTIAPTDDSKFQMIDIKHFNDIMLEPFISINEYAKKYNVEPPDEGSNIEDLHKEEAANDEISSLHSDGSLPDVIAELLKRNIITEPFKFDTPSNINSTTMSSESTLSILALSKARRQKRKSSVMFHNKENMGETSDSMSISSNPDLENAFKKLGLGWASSTLKKTKERLALSSSSNTSSSSLSQFKIKSFNQEIPALVTDSVSSALLSKKKPKGKNLVNIVKNFQQQTNLGHSMTVKEFLTNELADKITFNNNDDMNESEEEFVSLYETKMPEGLKQQSVGNRENQSVNDSIRSGANRARTSTPVQIFKSSAYHSSSSSNVSNGLFSNADDLSSVKMTSNSMKNHSTSDKDDLTIPNFSLKMKKGSDCSKSD